ncbi:excisionase family DNA-binding protein [Antribacter gilvus]|uniref:excisionase family DNA-binding protein n=1 Tax=Antribacter gilvus TaxID=2304675 RepID=UPI000F76F677|nr:excisionase family DNA-binding protein [Antribacter gilvus]
MSTVLPRDAALTTQEAADLLDVSRLTLVKLLETGKIPFHKVNAGRRVLVSDVLDHRTEMDKRRRVVEEAVHHNEMAGASVSDDSVADSGEFIAGTIDAQELVRRARARYGLA